MEEKYTMYTLGSRGSRPSSGDDFNEFGGATSCYIIKKDKYALVIDCGTGLYQAKELLSDCEVVDVAFTHMHYDHILGLLDWSVFPRNGKLTFYSAFSNWFGAESINEFIRPPFWPVPAGKADIVDIVPDGSEFELHPGLKISFYPAKHPNEACLMKLRLDDYVVAVVFDCEFATEQTLKMIKGSDLLIYDGMMDDSEYPHCIGWGHSTWSEGCRIARDCGVGELLITHHHPNHTDAMINEYEKEAKHIFSNVIFARVGDVQVLTKEK